MNKMFRTYGTLNDLLNNSRYYHTFTPTEFDRIMVSENQSSIEL